MRHVAQGGENDKTCQDAGQGVDDGYSQGVPEGKDIFGLVSFLQRALLSLIDRDCVGVVFGILLHNVVVEGVVAGHGHQGAKTNPDGVEYLNRSIHPHLKHRRSLPETTDHRSLPAPIINSHKC